MTEDEQMLVSTKTLSKLLDIPEKTIRAWVYKRTIPFRKVGKLVRFDLKEVRAWVNRGKMEPIEPGLVCERL